MKRRKRGRPGAVEAAARGVNTDQHTEDSTTAIHSQRPLDQKHRDELHASGLTDETIEEAGIYSAENSEIKNILGYQPKHHDWLRGWVIPFPTADGANTGYARVKLDYPRTDKSGKTIKYESPWKVPNRAYFPPGFAAAFPNADIILITEGEKKALAGMQTGIPTIGLVGVDAWQQKRERRDNGRAYGERLLIPDLGALKWMGRQVVIFFDSDAAEKLSVRQAADHLAIALAKAGATVRIAKIPPAGDGKKVGLDDFLVVYGHEGSAALRDLINKAQPARLDSGIQVNINQALGHHHDNGAIVRHIGLSIDGVEKDCVALKLDSDVARCRQAKKWAEAFGLDLADMEGRLRELTVTATEQTQEARSKAKAKSDPRSRETLLVDRDAKSDEVLASMPQEAIREAEDMLLDPRLIDRSLADIAAVGVVGEKILALSTYLIGTSRLLRKPLSGRAHGPSSSGKSFTIDTTATLFPPEVVFRATDITANALYYLEPGSLIHTLVVAGERSGKQDDDRAEATRALREMLSGGELNKVVTLTDGGSPRTKHIWQPGPIAFIESTTLTDVFDEDANRCLALSSDESSEQTERVVKAIASLARNGNSGDRAGIVLRHYAIQRLLRRVEVNISYADKLAEAMPKQRPQARRAIGHALDMIRAIALLHQRQRAKGDLHHGDTIQADIFDYAVARRLLTGPLGRALGGEVTPAVANFGKRLRDRYGPEVFTPAQAVKDDSILSSRNKANEYLRALADVGAAECTEEHKGNKPSQWRMIGEPTMNGAAWLPKVHNGEFV